MNITCVIGARGGSKGVAGKNIRPLLGKLLKALIDSLQPFLAGYGLAVVIGVPLGLIIGRFAFLEAALGVYVTAGFAMPLVALVPLLTIVLAIFTTFPIFVNFRASLDAYFVQILMPKAIAGQKVNYIVLDDASDTTAAVNNARKLITEHKVDIILGSTTTPNSLAMIDVVAEAQVPMISMAASARIVEPVDAKKRWVFKTPQNDIMMSLAIVSHMADQKVKTVAFIGFADALFFNEDHTAQLATQGDVAGFLDQHGHAK